MEPDYDDADGHVEEVDLDFVGGMQLDGLWILACRRSYPMWALSGLWEGAHQAHAWLTAHFPMLAL